MDRKTLLIVAGALVGALVLFEFVPAWVVVTGLVLCAIAWRWGKPIAAAVRRKRSS